MAQYSAETERAQPVAAPVANPAVLGLCGFATTTFVLSCINAGIAVPGAPAVGITIVIGLAVFYGGLAQLLAGMWEFKAGNTFGAAAFTSYGAFWLSFAAIFIPGFGILSSFIDTKTSMPGPAFAPAVGLYLLAWTIITLIFLLATLRSNVALVAVFFVLLLTFIALVIEFFGGGSTWSVIGGILGIITAVLAWYVALAGLLASVNAPFSLPVGPLS